MDLIKKKKNKYKFKNSIKKIVPGLIKMTILYSQVAYKSLRRIL